MQEEEAIVVRGIRLGAGEDLVDPLPKRRPPPVDLLPRDERVRGEDDRRPGLGDFLRIGAASGQPEVLRVIGEDAVEGVEKGSRAVVRKGDRRLLVLDPAAELGDEGVLVPRDRGRRLLCGTRLRLRDPFSRLPEPSGLFPGIPLDQIRREDGEEGDDKHLGKGYAFVSGHE